MYNIYFKQALEMLKQNKFISIITVIGTALAIMMVMVIIVTDSIKHVDIAPEVNRSKTFYVKRYTKKSKDQTKNSIWQSTISYELYKNYLSEFKTPEYTTAVDKAWNGNQFMVKKENANERFLSEIRMVDASYWKVLSFSFLDGKPFTEEDFKSGIRNAVISQNLAKRVFGNDKVLGKNIEIDFNLYKVIGIIKDVPQTFTYGYGEAYIPYTSKNGYNNRNYHILYLLKDKKDVTVLTEEIQKAQRKFDSADPENNITFHGPYNQRQLSMQETRDMKPDEKTANRKMIFIFTVLLLIPAVNLSSFSMSQIKRRIEEIGVRKAFGAKKYIILIQILFENLITTFIGGIIGLILSYFIVMWLKSWLLDIGAESVIPIHALISYPVLIGVFLACFVLNLLSAGIPAYRASKAAIVDSLNKKNM